MKQKIFFLLFMIGDILTLFFPKKLTQKSLALIKVDAIGDYILFRNFFKYIRNSARYRDYQVILIGNELWKPIFEHYDDSYVDHTIWINKNYFVQNFSYRFKKLVEIRKKGIAELVYCAYSREFFVDSIALSSGASYKTAFDTNLSNLTKWQKKISDRFYDQLIHTADETMFEFYRNKIFIEKFINQTIDIQKPFLDTRNQKEDLSKVFGAFVVLFIEASNSSKEWSINNFFEVGKFFFENYNYKIIICGGKEHNIVCEHYMINMTGKTTLEELIAIIKGSKMLISNDTGAVHIANSLATKTICISKGDQYGRFNPYPSELSKNIKFIFPDEIKYNQFSFDEIALKYQCGSSLDINTIQVDDVLAKIRELNHED